MAEDCVAGRGVRASRTIPAGAIIESCPVIVLSAEEFALLSGTGLDGYAYEWDDSAALALGYGSLYNHSDTPNAEFWPNFDDMTVEIAALEDIADGDEVLIDYTAGGTTELWFDPTSA